MKCSCMEASNSYERLPHVSNYLEVVSSIYGDSEDKDSSTEKQEEVVFYNDDNSYQTVIVEKNLCASDLCQLLALKNHVSKDANWAIVEHWIDLGLERSLEDNEDILAVHQDMETFCRRTNKKLIFRKDYVKYEFFQNPQQFFPSSMIDIADLDESSKTATLQSILASGDDCPVIFSLVWVRDANKQTWSKGYLVLKDRKLYLSFKVEVTKKLLRSCRLLNTSSDSSPCSSLSSSPSQDNKISHEEAEVFADLTKYQVYRTLNAKNHLKAPTEFGVCLRPTGTTIPSNSVDPPLAALKCFACESERARLCWTTAMRLAKYGKQLRENYRSFRNKHLESMNSKDYNNYILPTESFHCRVAMDFTGNQGRIVDDPKEAKAIALSEGYSWKRRWRPVLRQPASKLSSSNVHTGVHIGQPWFHPGVSRENAAALVAKHGTIDGVFLVRVSQSNPGAFVLTIKVGSKVIHKEISPIPDVALDGVFYSLDGGQTKFYDLVQLVDFYQLNSAGLGTRLTHCIVHAGSGNLPNSRFDNNC